MVKRTIYIGSEAYLTVQNQQLKLLFEKDNEEFVPIEDIGIIVIDNRAVTISQYVIESLLKNNSGLIICNSNHMPQGLLMNLDSNHTQSEHFSYQINASSPLKKQLWQQTVQAKIKNQALHLLKRKHPNRQLIKLSENVLSGDSNNKEANAAAYYWKTVYKNKINRFKRFREGASPNHLLNYGYAILRAVVARSLAISGLLPTLGIHHRNKYNAYCLADDMMEPYRPYVDDLVWDIMYSESDLELSNKYIKQQLLSIPVLNVKIDGKGGPLMHACQRTTASLQKCFRGEKRKLLFPDFE